MQGRVLIIAGSDSGGGAGIQADIKTVTMLGGYAATAITALTAQNTLGVAAIHDVPDAFVEQQMRAVLDDIGADAIKTGMLHRAGVIETAAQVLEDYPHIPLILDPVMVSTSGTALLEPDAVEILVKKLFPRAMLVTPNLPEAEMLLTLVSALSAPSPLAGEGRDGERGVARTEPAAMLPLTDLPPQGGKVSKGEQGITAMQTAAARLLALGSASLLLKGGHDNGDILTDILAERTGDLPLRLTAFSSPRIHSRHTHGTGCTLASAIATGIAQGMNLEEAVVRARAYVLEAIRTAPGLGKGHGPLNHGHPVKMP